MTVGPYRGGKVHVLSEKCSTCVFRPGNLMHLQPGRVKQMVDESIADGAGITCHQTLPYGNHPEALPATCRGFYDAHRDKVQALQVAERIGIIEEDSPPV